MTNQPRKIICVDDEPMILEIAAASLQTLAGVTTLKCHDSRDALDLISAEQPDLVVLDVMMPEVDGLTILKTLRNDETMCALPVLMMTARSEPEHIAEYRALGADRVIPKPFDPSGLIECVRGMWPTVQ